MIALFFDTETTGFKSSEFTPEIVQIGAILQDTETRRVLGEINAIVATKEPIPPRVSEIHGITDELSQKFGLESHYAQNVFALFVAKADVMVAHNIAFDLGIIKDAWPMVSAMIETKMQYCTMREATDVIQLPPGNYHGKTYSTYKPPKLIEAYKHFFDAEFDNQHDAMADVRACRDVYFALQDVINGVVA